MLWPVGLDGRCAAEGKHLFVVLSFAACISARTHTQLPPLVDKRALTRRVTPDGSEQLVIAPSPPSCFVGRCSPPFFFSLLWSPCWIVPSFLNKA